MFEETDNIRDEVNFSELTPKQQEYYHILAMQQIILGLILHLREPLYTYLQDREVKRDLEHSTASVRQSTEIEGAFPSPREVRQMIRSDGFWLISKIDPEKHSEAMKLTERLARLLYEALPRAK